MTNEQLAELRDPEHRMHPQWWRYHFVGPNSSGCTISGDAEMAASDDWQPTGEPSSHIPHWHADDLACFRDWRPVLLAAGWAVYDGALDCYALDEDGCIQAPPRPTTYRAAILAAVAWLAEHEPELLREAIARVEDGK